MPPGIAEVEAQALQLTPEERVRLADRLLSSLSTDVSVEEAWSAEVDHRIAELEAGSVNPVPIEDALARARRAIR